MTDKQILDEVYTRLKKVNHWQNLSPSQRGNAIKKQNQNKGSSLEAGNDFRKSTRGHRWKTVRKVVKFIEREWLIQQQQKVAQQNPLKINKP